MQLIANISQVVVPALGFAGGVELLEANDVGILLTDEFQHFGFMAGGAFLFGDVIVKTADIPGEYAQCMGRFRGSKAIAGMEGPEAMYIGPAEYQGYQGYQGPAPAGGEEKAKDNEDQHDQEQ